MDGTVDWRMEKCGILLGSKVLLIYCSLCAAIDKNPQDCAHPFGMWMQNRDIELAAISMLGITLIGFV